MARPRLQIDEAQIEELGKLHCTYEEIAAVVGCSIDTLQRRYAAQITKGREVGKMTLRRAQFRAAEGGNVTMQIWLGKQLLNQKDTQVIETRELPQLIVE